MWKRVAIPRTSDHPSCCFTPPNPLENLTDTLTGSPVEVLCNAIGARHVRRHELALHAHADGVNRPPAGDWLLGRLSMMA